MKDSDGPGDVFSLCFSWSQRCKRAHTFPFSCSASGLNQYRETPVRARTEPGLGLLCSVGRGCLESSSSFVPAGPPALGTQVSVTHARVTGTRLLKATAVPAALLEKEMALGKQREAWEASPCH